jgi:hypothetical protein
VGDKIIKDASLWGVENLLPGCRMFWKVSWLKPLNTFPSPLFHSQNMLPEVGYQWLTPIILATQEAEISRILVQSQPGQIDHEILSRNTHHKKELTHTQKNP